MIEQIQAEIMKVVERGDSYGVEFLVERVREHTEQVFTSEIRRALVRLLRRGDLELNDDFRVFKP